MEDRVDEIYANTGPVARISTLFTQAGNDDIKIVDKLVSNHDIQYKAINFGEDVIKEMIMSSVFGIPVSAKVSWSHIKIRENIMVVSYNQNLIKHSKL